MLVAPTVATYNAYAAGLVGDHALRLGIEPSARLLGEAGRWQLAHDVVEHWAGDLDTDLAPSTVTGRSWTSPGGSPSTCGARRSCAEVERLVATTG